MNTYIKTGLGIVVIAILIIIGMTSGSSSPKNSALTIGVIDSLTGDYGAVGENTLKGIKVAEHVYEKKTGKKVEFIVEDDGGDGVKGLSAFKKLVQVNHVDGMINFFTTTMDTIYAPAKTEGYPVMMVAFQANNIADDFVFQMTPSNDDVWPKFVKLVKNGEYDLNNVVLVYSKAAAQESFMKSFALTYGDKATQFGISSGGKDFRSDAAKIAAFKPTTIVFFMTPDDGALLTKTLVPMLDKSTKLIYDIQLVTGTANYKKILGGLSTIEGAMTLSPEGERSQDFIDAYHELYPNEEPGFLADFGYDTFMVYMESYDKDNAQWISNLRSYSGKGPSGQIMFNDKGIRVPDMVVKKVIGGELVTTGRLEF
jgi:ABC-type branched-subunit amino acid transport system substrate-binding protein